MLGEFFRRSGMKRSLRRAEVVLLWPRVAGPEVARFSSARALRDGVLYVDVSDSETAMHLSLQRRRFLAVFHDTYKTTDVKEIRFQAGRPGPSGRSESRRGPQRGIGPASSAADRAPEDAPAPDPHALSRLARELGGLDLKDEVSAVLLTAGRSLLALHAKQRAAGYAECPTCGALHPGPLEELSPREIALAGRDTSGYDLPDRQLCSACRRHAAAAGVKAAARELALDPTSPTPLLSDPERAVALRLAAAALDVDMRTAFVEALADPRTRQTLASLARRRVALAAAQAYGSPGDSADAALDVLDPRYRRFLDLEGDEQDRS